MTWRNQSFTTSVDPIIVLPGLVSIFKAFTLSSQLPEYFFHCSCYCFCAVTSCQVSSTKCPAVLRGPLLLPFHHGHSGKYSFPLSSCFCCHPVSPHLRSPVFSALPSQSHTQTLTQLIPGYLTLCLHAHALY